MSLGARFPSAWALADRPYGAGCIGSRTALACVVSDVAPQLRRRQKRRYGWSRRCIVLIRSGSGRRIALALGTLGIFLTASTMGNILQRVRLKPVSSQGVVSAGEAEQWTARRIVAQYPDHEWSVDRTRVWRWHVCATRVLAPTDHHSRRIIALCPLAGSNAGWVIDVLEWAFARHRPLRHLIMDQESVLTYGAFRDLLDQWRVRQRLGAANKHGSVAVAERLIRSLKHEWLCGVR